jgi:uncharacterized protein YjbI with pentapeptide repeats
MRQACVLTALVAAIVLLGSLTLARADAPAQQLWRGCNHTKLWKPTDEQLRIVLARHAGWYSKLTMVALPAHDPYLERVRTPGWSWLDEARLHPEQATLCHVNLMKANLSDVNLSQANLSDAILADANLNRANLSYAKLRDAYLGKADLSSADLSNADLSRATLEGTKLSKARLARADLTGATYAPQGEPLDSYVVGIKGLRTVNIPPGDDIGLIQLRKLLQDAGLRDDERAATYVIERSTTSQRLLDWRRPNATIEGVFRLIAFDWTTAYGLSPGRALVLILAFGVIFTGIYFVAIWGHPARGRDDLSGIFQVFPADRIDTTASVPALHKDAAVAKIREPGFWKALRSAAYFSILSAFNIGFESFSVGDWIRRVQAREYTLQPTGWVRVVSGLQSLLSLYLLAIWVLTYFGRPFQ